MDFKGFTLIELMVVVVIIGILAATAIPNSIRMQNRAKEADVKAVAHSTQLAVEDYKTNPGQEGIKPTTIAKFLSYLPTNVLSKKNPFNTGEGDVRVERARAQLPESGEACGLHAERDESILHRGRGQGRVRGDLHPDLSGRFVI